MKKLLLSLLAATVLSVPAFSYYAAVRCAAHDYGNCWSTGQTQFYGTHQFVKYDCSCGDSLWVRQF